MIIPKKYLFFLFILNSSFLLIFSDCKKKTNPSTNFDFVGKSLSEVQSHAIGKWRLNYTIGGIAGSKTQSNNGQYIIINAYKFILGFSTGQQLDSTLIWKKIPTNSGKGDSTYLMVYGILNGLVLNEIKSDTLIVSDYLISDGYNYYYTKF